MTVTDKHIVETYLAMLETLSSSSKKKIIEGLSKSVEAGEERKEDDFYSVFGAFVSDKPAEEIIKEIKGSRKFRKKNIKL